MTSRERWVRPDLPLGLRTKDDRLGPEGLTRWMLDRQFATVNGAYGWIFNKLTQPLWVATRMANENGSVSIFDAGCGTGRTLFEFVTAVREQANCPPENVTGTGLSLYDYSRESMDPAVSEAFDGDLRYQVGNVEQLGRYGLGKYNIVFSQEMLRYVRHKGPALDQMRGVLDSDGMMYFNCEATENGQLDPAVDRTLGRWRQAGYLAMSQRSTTTYNSTATSLGVTHYNVVVPPVPPA